MVDDGNPGPDDPSPVPALAASAPAPPGPRFRPGLAVALVAAGVAIGVLCSTTGAGALWLAARSIGAHRSTAPSTRSVCSWPPRLGGVTREVGTPPASPRRSGMVTMTLTTNLGVIEIRMDRSKTPCTAASFEHLAGKKFFDGSHCHRLTTRGIFVLQCGDPSGTGLGGPAYRYSDENLPANGTPAYRRGTVAMANAGAGTNGSQFFINYADEPPELPPDYAVIGTVVRGMDVVDKVAKGGCDDPTDQGEGVPRTRIEIRSVTVTG